MSFAEALNKALDEIGFPQKGDGRQTKLAKELMIESRKKISQKAVRKWLEDEGMPIDENLIYLAKITHKPLQYFIDAKMGLAEKSIYKNFNIKTFFSDEINYVPEWFLLGKKTKLSFCLDFIENTYYLYELNDGKEIIKIMRRIKKEGFETFLISDTPLGKSYNLADYEYKFIGSLVDIHVIY